MRSDRWPDPGGRRTRVSTLRFCLRLWGLDPVSVHPPHFVDLVSTHTNFAQIRTADGRFIEQLIRIDLQTLQTNSNGVLGLLLFLAVIEPFGLGSMPAALLVAGGIFGANHLMIAGHLRDAARLRLAVTLVFGLIHGFGFAADLLEMRSPVGRLAGLLVGFIWA